MHKKQLLCLIKHKSMTFSQTLGVLTMTDIDMKELDLLSLPQWNNQFKKEEEEKEPSMFGLREMEEEQMITAIMMVIQITDIQSLLVL